MISVILGLFCKRLTSNHMYSRVNWEKFLQHVQTLLSEKPKTLSETFIAFWNPCKIWLILINRISFIALIFCRLLALRNVVTWMPESFCFRTPLDSQRVQEVYTEALLPKTFINPREIEWENISVCQIWNLSSLWEEVDCRSHVFLS